MHVIWQALASSLSALTYFLKSLRCSKSLQFSNRLSQTIKSSLRAERAEHSRSLATAQFIVTARTQCTFVAMVVRRWWS